MNTQSKLGKLLDKLSLTRRSFLKVFAATAGTLAVTTLAGCQKEETPAPESVSEQKPVPGNTNLNAGKWYKNACPRNCHDTCSIRTQVVDGKIVRIKGDEKNPYTAGNLCVKMNHYVNYQYSPDRLMYPMKRVGKKGEGKFERISWDEAYAMIVENTKSNIEQFGPNSNASYFYSGTLGYVSNYSMPARYFNKIGATGCDGTICLATGKAAIPYTYGKEVGCDPEEYANTKLYVSWGTNEAATGVHQTKFIKTCQQKGGKVVVINPTPTPVSRFADLYIRPKPGTDAALAMGVINILINENLYDKEFLQANTIGFDELRVEAAKYSTESVSEITGVPVEQIVEFARLYGSINPSIIRIGYGMQRRSNGGSIVRAITFLPVLTGNIGKGNNAGYTFFNLFTWDIDWGVVGASHLNTNPDPRIINMIELAKALNGELETTQKEPIKQLFVFVANPMSSTPNINAIKKGMEREDLFTVVADLFHTDTVDYADVVLPCTTLFEQVDINQGYLSFYLNLNEKAVEPLGECKSNFQIFKELSAAMGFSDTELQVTEEQVIEELLKTAGPLLNTVTLDYLKENHWYKVKTSVPYGDLDFPTPSGKIEFSSETFRQRTGQNAVAEHLPGIESAESSPELFKKYPLQFMTLHTKNYINGQMSQLPHIQAVAGDPVIFMHPQDAQARSLTDGEMVLAKNDRGEALLKLKITEERVLPGVVLAYASPWNRIENGTTVNATTSDTLSDIGNGSIFHSNLVEVAKA